MKKIILYILLGVAVVAFLIMIFRRDNTEYGTRAEVQVPQKSDIGKSSVKEVTFIVDNSGSMRGYVDFSGNKPEFKNAEKTLLAKTGVFMGNCENGLKAKTVAVCNGKSYDTAQTLQSLSNYTAFSGPITEVDKLIGAAINNLKNDSSICVVVSDMVLSYGATELKNKKDNFYNLHSLANLKTDIRNQFHRLKNEGKGVLIVKYVGDFNGQFYYNYTENLEPSHYGDVLMKERPFYFTIIGGVKAIKDLCNASCLPTGYTEVFSSLSLDQSDYKKENYSVTQPADQVQWILGNPDPKKEAEAAGHTYTITTDKRLRDSTSKFTFSFPSFEIPAYVSPNLTVVFDNSQLTSVSTLNANSSFSVETVPFKSLFSSLSKVEEVKIEYVSPRYVDFSITSVKDDIKASPDEMKGKTWGFEAIAEALYEAFGITQNDVNTVLSMEFELVKD